ncbi:unnamed protein product [Symbiodinium natans]|uniref:Uncharacterized protein n=1 Tax=Symbiodinium natans TaxID=878477 RepID=A0A812K0H7_9DINO|nr:unnamed protein product [Symbiodinium natans]
MVGGFKDCVSDHVANRVQACVLTAPRPQQPILDASLRTQLLAPRKGHGQVRTRHLSKIRLPPKGELRERVVLRSLLPDRLKMECLERLDKMEKDQAERLAEAAREGTETASEKRRRRSSQGPVIPGGFYKHQQVVARHDLYLEGDHIMALYMDKAVVLGPSKSTDPNRVCVQFEARRDGSSMWVNVLPDEIMSEENGQLMQSIILKAEERKQQRLRNLTTPPAPGQADEDEFPMLLPPETELGVEGTEAKPAKGSWTSTAPRSRGSGAWLPAPRPAPAGAAQETATKLTRDSRSLPALLGVARVSPRPVSR